MSSFDTVSQEWLIRFVEHRIGDKRIIVRSRHGSRRESWKMESWWAVTGGPGRAR